MSERGKGGSWHPYVHCTSGLCGLQLSGTGGTRERMRENARENWNRRAEARAGEAVAYHEYESLMAFAERIELAQEKPIAVSLSAAKLLRKLATNPPTGDAAGMDSVDAARDGFYLACYKDGRSRGVMTWWRPDDAGYTPYLDQAGVYTAEQIAADPRYYDNAHTVPVPVSFIDGRDSRQVDVGLSKNGQIFWSAKNLRAAIAAAAKPADFQECAAQSGSCVYGPYGRHGESQCKYCGAAETGDAQDAQMFRDLIYRADDSNLNFGRDGKIRTLRMTFKVSAEPSIGMTDGVRRHISAFLEDAAAIASLTKTADGEKT
jgi:hypothetical protein